MDLVRMAGGNRSAAFVLAAVARSGEARGATFMPLCAGRFCLLRVSAGSGDGDPGPGVAGATHAIATHALSATRLLLSCAHGRVFGGKMRAQGKGMALGRVFVGYE